MATAAIGAPRREPHLPANSESVACQQCGHYGWDRKTFWGGGDVVWGAATPTAGSRPLSKGTWPYEALASAPAF